MAFVNALAVGSSGSMARQRSRASGVTALRARSRPAAAAPTRMGYGDYSYVTDKTKGHVQQYYVDKFRVASDFGRGMAPASDADAVLGRDAKGAVLIPEGGVPQPVDDILKADMSEVPEDPRVAESKGAVYAWDAGFEDPAFAPESYADLEDEDVAENAFAAFREANQAERGAVLGQMDAALKQKIAKIKGGFSENYLLSMEGKYEANYARLQKIAEPMLFSPISGKPQTELPGFPYMPAVSALDFQPKPGDEVNGAFWKEDAPKLNYQKPMGADTPELPYNSPAPVEQLKEATIAKGLLPADDE